jgi:hypothetical protein
LDLKIVDGEIAHGLAMAVERHDIEVTMWARGVLVWAAELSASRLKNSSYC